MPIAVNNIRVGHRYRIKNYGDTMRFEVVEVLSEHNFKARDVETLEYFTYEEVLRYGRGKDYELEEL